MNTLLPDALQRFEWRPVKGYEETYEVSEYGEVNRIQYFDRRVRKPTLLSPALDSYGYLHVALVQGGKSKVVSIHTIVMDAFIGPKPRGKERNHIDGNKLNNHFSNLEYISHADNIRHGFKLGLYPIGEASSQAKLTEQQVREIRSLYKPHTKGYGAHSLARRYNVNAATVWAIIKRRTWQHVRLIEKRQQEAGASAIKSSTQGAK